MGQCASIFYRREQFQSHLRDKHGIEKDDDIRDKCKRCRIGRNGQTAFWCGFCKQVVELKTAGLEAWEERFSHIDDLHYKKGQTIYDWVPLDSDIPKGLMERGSLAESEQADDDNDRHGNEGSSDDGDDSSSTSKCPSPQPAGKKSTNSTGASADRDTGSKSQATPSRRGRIWNCVSLLWSCIGSTKGRRALTDHCAGCSVHVIRVWPTPAHATRVWNVAIDGVEVATSQSLSLIPQCPQCEHCSDGPSSPIPVPYRGRRLRTQRRTIPSDVEARGGCGYYERQLNRIVDDCGYSYQGISHRLYIGILQLGEFRKGCLGSEVLGNSFVPWETNAARPSLTPTLIKTF